MNRRGLWLVEALLAHAEERKVAVAPDRGGRPVHRLRDRGPRRPARGRRAGAGLPGRPGRGRRSCPARSAGRPIPLGPGRHRPSGPGLPGQPVRRLGDQRGEVLRDGLGPDAGASPAREAIFDVIGFREDGRRRRRRARDPQAADARGRRQDRRRLPGRARGGHPARRATASLAGGVQVVARSVETALAQARRAQVRPRPDRLGPRDGPAAAGRRQTTWPRSAGPTTRSSTAPAWSSPSPATTPASKTIGPQVPSSASRDHGEPFAAIFARYNNDFYAVDPHLFSPAEVVFQNVETGRVHAFGERRARRPGPVVLL